MYGKWCVVVYDIQHVDDNSMKIASLGGIEVTLTAMRMYTLSAEVQEMGCHALGCLALNGRKRREVISMSFHLYFLAFACKCLV